MLLRGLCVSVASALLAGLALVPAHGTPSVSSALSAPAYELIPLGDAAIWPAGVALSRNGRYVAMTLRRDPSNWYHQVVVWDRVQHVMLPVSVTSSGEPGKGASTLADITPDGRYVLFASLASNLVAGDTNGHRDVFLRDVRAGTTTRVSLSSTGEQLPDRSTAGSVTADGQVVFFSTKSAAVPGDRNGHPDVYARNTRTGRMSLVSRNSRGRPGNGASYGARASDDGRWVAFLSLATNLAPGDRTWHKDVFLRDQATGHTWLASVKPKSIAKLRVAQGGIGGISGDGQVVAFDAVRFFPGGNSALRAFVYRQATHKARELLPSTAGSPKYSVAHVNSLHGDRVTMVTDASLTDNDNAWGDDVYMLRLSTGVFTLLTNRDAPANATLTWSQELSRDGHVLVFAAGAQLSSDDTDHNTDAYLRDIP